MARSAFVTTLILVLAVFIVGCGRTTQRTVVTPGGAVKVTSHKSATGKTDTVTVEGKEGKTTVSTNENKTVTEAELGAPVYPGAKQQMSGSYEGNSGGKQASVEQHMLATKDSFEKVVDFYKSNLKDVKNQNVVANGDQKMAMFQVGDEKNGMMVHVMWDPKEKQTTIQVIKGQQ